MSFFNVKPGSVIETHHFIHDMKIMSDSAQCLYRYFCNISDEKYHLPHFNHFDIISILNFTIAEHVWLLKKIDNDYKINVCGSGIEYIFNKTFHQKYLRDILKQEDYYIMDSFFDQLIKEKIGTLNTGLIYDTNLRILNGEKIIIPIIDRDSYCFFGCFIQNKMTISSEKNSGKFYFNFQS